MKIACWKLRLRVCYQLYYSRFIGETLSASSKFPRMRLMLLLLLLFLFLVVVMVVVFFRLVLPTNATLIAFQSFWHAIHFNFICHSHELNYFEFWRKFWSNFYSALTSWSIEWFNMVFFLFPLVLLAMHDTFIVWVAVHQMNYSARKMNTYNMSAALL